MTFSGNFSPASRRRRSVHSRSVVARRARRGGRPPRPQAGRQRDGGEPRGVQDLVRVRVSDPREERRVRERPLQRVVLAPQALANAPRDASSGSRPPGSSAARASGPETTRTHARFFGLASVRSRVPWSKRRERRPIFFGMGRGASPALHRRRPAIMRCRTRKRSPSRSGSWFESPSSPSREKYEPFPQPGHPTNRAALDRGEGRPDGPQDERAREAHLPKRRTLQEPLEMLGVDDDVRKLRHAGEATAGRVRRE